MLYCSLSFYLYVEWQGNLHFVFWVDGTACKLEVILLGRQMLDLSALYINEILFILAYHRLNSYSRNYANMG